MKKPIVVSACLLGDRCRYDGASKPNAAVISLAERFTLIPVCPEQLGGLPTPRVSAERQGACVVNENGLDVSVEYARGAAAALAIAQENGCTCAVLKERSPSCGCGEIYDGSFSRRLIAGNGVTAELFLANGIAVYGEGTENLSIQLDK